jgi:uncharacterized membrane protein YfcA
MQTNPFRSLWRAARTALSWALVGGFTTAAMGLLAVVFHSDTGHVPRFAVPVMLGIPGFILGLLAGAAFSCFATAVHETYRTRLGERMLLGAAIGAVAGQIIVRAFSQRQLTFVMMIIIGAWLAVVLGWRRHSKRRPEISP